MNPDPDPGRVKYNSKYRLERIQQRVLVTESVDHRSKNNKKVGYCIHCMSFAGHSLRRLTSSGLD